MSPAASSEEKSGTHGSNENLNGTATSRPDNETTSISRNNNKLHRGTKVATEDDDDDVVKKDADVSTRKEPERKIMVALVVFMLITIFGYPPPIEPSVGPLVHHVWYYGWITAVSTGLGVVPLMFVPEVGTFWIGVANAVAAGMMTAASYSLIYEGCTFEEQSDNPMLSNSGRTLFGAIFGIIFILISKQYVDEDDDLMLLGHGNDARKVLLITLVMTLHSFSEGVGIGVSFGGEHGSTLGVFISASLAVHNIPEGLAVAIVLLPRKISKMKAVLWCIITSIPQPIMAVPAFLFVNTFIPILPAGLGFAGGAMAWVAVFELLTEAYEETNALVTGAVSSISLAGMLYIQDRIQND